MQTVFHHSTDDKAFHARVTANVANLLADETVDLTDVAVVTNSGGLTLVTRDSPERDTVESLIERGVDFKQCANTLTGAEYTETDLLDGVEVVSSGVGELTRLQAEGYAYISP